MAVFEYRVFRGLRNLGLNSHLIEQFVHASYNSIHISGDTGLDTLLLRLRHKSLKLVSREDSLLTAVDAWLSPVLTGLSAYVCSTAIHDGPLYLHISRGTTMATGLTRTLGIYFQRISVVISLRFTLLYD